MLLLPTTLSAGCKVRPRQGVLARDVGGEMVVLDVDHGLYYGLNEVATKAWTLWIGGLSLGEVEACLSETYEVDHDTLRADLANLVHDLARNGLIDVAAD